MTHGLLTVSIKGNNYAFVDNGHKTMSRASSLGF